MWLALGSNQPTIKEKTFQGRALRVSLYINAFISQERDGALRKGLAITFWLLGMNCAASCRRAEGERREAVDFLSLRGGLKRVKEKRAAEGEAGAGRGP